MLLRRLLAVSLLVLLQGCSPGGSSMPLGQADYAGYQRETRAWVAAHRDFQSPDHAAELGWNSPAQWRPEGPPKRGVLLVHGLGDSPWSFHDVAARLAADGALVRTVLLPGHGTQPADMLDVSLEQWQQVLREQARILREEVPEVYLGGFSTGANLVLDYAYEHPDIAGLILFSPAFRPRTAYAWVTPYIAWAKPWLAEREGVRPQQSLVRYLNVPTNGFAQFYRSSQLARERLEQRPYEKPVFVALTEHDSVLDTPYILEAFNLRFSHPRSRLVWYGAAPAQASSRVLVRDDHLPQYRISQFSHMGLLFSPDNPLYGVAGAERLCWNGQSEEGMAQCLRGEAVWYSDWGYREAGKVHARLTFNPYFDWQSGVMLGVLDGQPGQVAAQ